MTIIFNADFVVQNNANYFSLYTNKVRLIVRDALSLTGVLWLGVRILVVFLVKRKYDPSRSQREIGNLIVV